MSPTGVWDPLFFSFPFLFPLVSADTAGNQGKTHQRNQGHRNLRDLGAGHDLQGPLVIEEHTMTLYAGPDDRVSVDRAGNYLIELR